MIRKYSEEVKQAMRYYFSCLQEKERRQYAAVKAIKLGYGGITYISKLLSIDHKTVLQGKKELLSPSLSGFIAFSRQRYLVGGRKKKLAQPDMYSRLSALLERHKAGSPTDEKV